jgi:trimeric autotransporter adhesin
MTTIDNALINGLLADAAYVAGLNSQLSVDGLRALLEPRMTPELAAYVADNFEVVTQVETRTGSSFDATVWRRKSDGQLFVSMRGTQEGSDWLADVDLALISGTARAQIADMVNWWLRITTASNQLAPQIKVVFPTSGPDGIQYFGFSEAVSGGGLLVGASNLEINGHSLGGQLATSFARIFGGTTVINHISTFNSAGFTTSSEGIFRNLQDMLGSGMPGYPSAALQSNYFARNGFNFATNGFWFNQIGQRVEVSNELGVGPTNHLMYKLTDGLALANALSQLDPGLTLARFNAIMEAASGTPEASLENMLDAVRRLFAGADIIPTLIGDAGNSAVSRLDYQTKLKQLALLESFQAAAGSLTLAELTNMPAAELAIRAEALNGLAYRYALSAMNPFAVLGPDSLYANLHNVGGRLDLHDLVSGTGSITRQWIADRAAFLVWKNDAFARDVNQSVDLASRQNWRFDDRRANVQINVFAGRVPVINPVNEPNQVSFGTAAGDSLNGGRFTDRLYGEEGDDQLNGGQGNDYLEGGLGFDTYVYQTGHGEDTILDVDGTGTIMFDGAQLGSGERIASYQWRFVSDLGREFYYWKHNEADGSTTLTITAAETSGSIRLRGFDDGELGIDLLDFAPPAQPGGDIELGTGGDDTLGQTLNLTKIGLGGHDLLWGVPDGWLDGGAGNDILTYAYFNGHAPRGLSTYGGEDSDFAFGTVYDDKLHAEGVAEFAALVENTASASPGEEREVLFGGAGDDSVAGGRGNDWVAGGIGSDVLYGGAGDDLLSGAGEIFFDVSVRGEAPQSRTIFNVHTSGRYDQTHPTIVINWPNALENFGFTLADLGSIFRQGMDDFGWRDGADVIFAGAGDDEAWGGFGDDVIAGEAGNDTLMGESGNDVLDGGDGDDTLAGGEGNDVLIAGTGTDTLEGGAGDDTYHVDAGDIVKDTQGRNRISFGADIRRDMLRATQSGANLVLTGVGGGTITIENGAVGAVAEVDIEYGSFGFGEFLSTIAADDLVVQGGSGDEAVFGASGNDWIAGAQGSDTLEGGAGDDVYVLNLGDGFDLLTDLEGANVIEFGLGIAAADVTANVLFNSSSGTFDMHVGYGPGDTIVIANGHAGPIAEYRFDGGTVLSHPDIVARATQGFQLSGTEVSDSLFGGGGNDSLSGHSGDDALAGRAGHDTLSGADGDDELDGGEGNDTLFGDLGNDVLAGGTGDDELLAGEGNDNMSGDEGNDLLEAELGNDALQGGSGNDILRGGAGDDLLLGGAGTDTLEGGQGVDTYDLNVGDGADIVNDMAGANTIRFGAGITADAIGASILNATDGGIYLSLQYGATDYLLVKQDPARPGASASTFSFANGENLSQGELMARTLSAPLDYIAGPNAVLLYGSRFGDEVLGSARNDFIDGGDGNDVLQGEEGSDTLFGGAGDDLILGGTGDDLLTGGSGSDTYALRRGMGRDTVTEDPAAIGLNTLRLSADTVIADLAARRQGDDLYLHVRNLRDGVILTDYFAAGNSADAWQVESASGTTTSLADVLVNVEQSERAANVAQAYEQFEARARIAYESGLYSDGWKRGADGRFRRESTFDGTFSSSHNVRDIGASVVAESDDGAAYTRQSAPVLLTGQTFNQTLTSQTVQVLNTSNSVVVPLANGGNNYQAGEPPPAIININELIASGVSGIQLPENAVAISNGEVQTREFSADPAPRKRTTALATYQGGAQPTYTTQTITHVHNETTDSWEMQIADITGGDSDNFIHGGRGFSLIDGGAGDDRITAEGGIYLPSGLLPTDAIPGALLYGNVGNDELAGSAFDDVLIGGAGTDVMNGGDGNDTYLLFTGDGNDLIFDDGVTVAGIGRENVLEMPEGVTFADITAVLDERVETFRHRRPSDGGMDVAFSVETAKHASMLLSWSDGSVRIVLPHTETNAGTGIDLVRFSDGSSATMTDLFVLAGGVPDFDPHNSDDDDPTITYGGGGNDTMYGRSIGGAGRDTFIGSGLDDVFYGGELVLDETSTSSTGGATSLSTLWDEGNLYHGGAGDDTVWATAGSDIFEYGLGDGNDTVTDMLHDETFYGYGGPIGSTQHMLPQWEDPTGADPAHLALLLSSSDRLLFGEGIAPTDVAFYRERVGANRDLFLKVGVDDVGVRFENWYRAEINQLQGIEFDDSTIWDAGAIAVKTAEAQAVVRGSEGNDSLVGTSEDELFLGGAIDDSYSILRGGGRDRIYDTHGFDTLNLEVDPNSVTVTREADDIVISFDDTLDRVAIQWFAEPGARIEFVNFYLYGTIWDAATLEAMIEGSTNQPPSVANPIADQSATEDVALNFTVPANTFVDPDPADTLTYSASLADGSALPAWLTFNAQTRTFSGTPGNAEVGPIELKVTATDDINTPVSDVFSLTVANTNDAPTVANAIPNQNATEEAPFSFVVATDVFEDTDLGDTLTYSATLADGTALPSWLTFNASNRSFSGTPMNEDVASIEVKVTATDSAEASASDTFTVTVANTNDAPTLANPIADQFIEEGQLWTFSVPADTFSDIDPGEQLVLSASLSSGAALPSWMSFDGVSRTFSGTPPNGGERIFSVRVTATDSFNATVQEHFVVDVTAITFGVPGHAESGSDLYRDVFLGGAADEEFDGLGRDDRLYGAGGNDALFGGEGADLLDGGDGHDGLVGGTGNNILLGGLGTDWLIGGAGNDYIDTGGGAGGLSPFIGDVSEGADGMFGDDTIIFNRGYEQYSLNAGGHDELVIGADILPGDVRLRRILNFGLEISLPSDPHTWTIIEGYFPEGPEKSWTLRFLYDGSTLSYAEVNAIVSTPTAGDDALWGTENPDVLNGLGGNDLLVGLGGDDTYQFNPGYGQDTIDSTGGGFDVVQFGSGITASNVTVSKGPNNDLHFTVNGSADKLIVRNYYGGSTPDEFRFSDGAIWNEQTVAAMFPINGTSGSNTLQGTNAADVINGLGSADVLNGLGGNDTLDGGAGSDTMDGGSGNDTFIVDSTGDQVIEAANSGTDTVRSSVTRTLETNVENLVLTGSSNLNGTGNALDNSIIGNTGRNTLTGGAGNDWLEGGGNRDTFVGGTGNDTYVVDSTDDAITENASAGADTVRSSIAWTLGSNLENVVLTGTANINGIGNTLANELYGNSGNNVLTGNGGSDTLNGGAGTDTLVGGAGNDTYQFGRGYGADLVQENDGTSGNTDIARFLAGISEYQLWFQRTGNNLVATVIGTSDKLTVQNWYLGNANHVEQFKTAEGKTLLDSQVQNLVNAMAAFSPPAPGQETLPPNYATALNPVIAANWQ